MRHLFSVDFPESLNKDEIDFSFFTENCVSKVYNIH